MKFSALDLLDDYEIHLELNLGSLRFDRLLT